MYYKTKLQNHELKTNISETRKRKIHNNKDFKTLCLLINSTTKYKISMDTKDLNNTVDQLELIDIYRTLHSANYRTHIPFKCTWDTHQDRNILDHKTSLNKLERREIIPSTFSGHSEINQ